MRTVGEPDNAVGSPDGGRPGIRTHVLIRDHFLDLDDGVCGRAVQEEVEPAGAPAVLDIPVGIGFGGVEDSDIGPNGGDRQQGLPFDGILDDFQVGIHVG